MPTPDPLTIGDAIERNGTTARIKAPAVGSALLDSQAVASLTLTYDEVTLGIFLHPEDALAAAAQLRALVYANNARRNPDGLVEVLEALGLPAADPSFLTRYLTDPLVHALVYLVRQVVTAAVDAGIIDRENDAQRAELARAAVSLDPVDLAQLSARWMAAMDAPPYAIDTADDRPPRPTPAEVITAVVLADDEAQGEEWTPAGVAAEVVDRLTAAGYRIVSTAR